MPEVVSVSKGLGLNWEQTKTSNKIPFQISVIT